MEEDEVLSLCCHSRRACLPEDEVERNCVGRDKMLLRVVAGLGSGRSSFMEG